MSYVYKKGYWETKEHEMIRIEDMKTSHIKNVIKFLKRNPTFYDEEYGSLDLFNVELCFYDYIDNYYLVKDKIKELEFELRIRKSEGKDK